MFLKIPKTKEILRRWRNFIMRVVHKMNFRTSMRNPSLIEEVGERMRKRSKSKIYINLLYLASNSILDINFYSWG